MCYYQRLKLQWMSLCILMCIWGVTGLNLIICTLTTLLTLTKRSQVKIDSRKRMSMPTLLLNPNTLCLSPIFEVLWGFCDNLDLPVRPWRKGHRSNLTLDIGHPYPLSYLKLIHSNSLSPILFSRVISLLGIILTFDLPGWP